jgi:cytochrome c peroxidase
MINKIGIFIILILSIGLFSFIGNDPFFLVTKKDVQLKVPKGFPKPNYSFTNNKISPEGFVLGRQLFYDPILSKDSSISCGSCHQQYAAFSHIDHALAHGIGGQIGNRNVSSLQNLIWNKEFMWDGGINHIEVQAIAPITNKVEMAESLEHVIAKLNQRDDYKSAFYKAYKDSIITSEKMLKSLTQFMGLMISSNARYDRFVEGKEAFTLEEKKGLILFRAKCASCHKEPLFTDNAYRSNGIAPNIRLNDKGRFMITANENDLYKFKVPSLRNIELTFPYMHDGRFRNLSEVLNYYSDSTKYSTYSDPLITKIGKLSKEDMNCIQAFLLTLTDKSFIYDRRFADPNFTRKR